MATSARASADPSHDAQLDQAQTAHATNGSALQNAGQLAVSRIGGDRHPARDLFASIHRITPTRIGRFAKHELEEVLEHWPAALASAAAFVVAQVAAGALASSGVGAPVGALIETILLGARVAGGVGAGVAVFSEGEAWVEKASGACGDPAVIEEAGDHFIKMTVELVSFIVARRAVQKRVEKVGQAPIADIMTNLGKQVGHKLG